MVVHAAEGEIHDPLEVGIVRGPSRRPIDGVFKIHERIVFWQRRFGAPEINEAVKFSYVRQPSIGLMLSSVARVVAIIVSAIDAGHKVQGVLPNHLSILRGAVLVKTLIQSADTVRIL